MYFCYITVHVFESMEFIHLVEITPSTTATPTTKVMYFLMLDIPILDCGLTSFWVTM